MSINRISGNILQDNLVRGEDLAFQGNLLYISVQNNQIGINTASTTHTLTVNGDTNISDTLFANSITVTADISANSIDIDTLTANDISLANSLIGGNLEVESLTSQTFVLANGNVQGGNVIIRSSEISLGQPGNLEITPTGNNLLIINTSSGMILPLGNTLQRPDPAESGTARFNSETLRIEFYDGNSWQEITTAVTNQTLSGDGITVTFSLDRTATTASILVSLNGVLQLPLTSYSVTGNLIIFTEPPLSTDVIDIRFL